MRLMGGDVDRILRDRWPVLLWRGRRLLLLNVLLYVSVYRLGISYQGERGREGEGGREREREGEREGEREKRQDMKMRKKEEKKEEEDD